MTDGPFCEPVSIVAIMVSRKLVLVIEDEDDLRDEIVEYLRRHGYEVVAYASARAARERLGAWAPAGIVPHAVLCDESLPDGSGIEIFLDLAAELPNSRWILMSGAHDEDGRLTSATAAARPTYRVLEKPFALKSLKCSLED
jgi:DNA-binding response OmpR family regulator